VLDDTLACAYMKQVRALQRHTYVYALLHAVAAEYMTSPPLSTGTAMICAYTAVVWGSAHECIS
jgi:hypothetical protein